jgi:hypothetical protein
MRGPTTPQPCLHDAVMRSYGYLRVLRNAPHPSRNKLSTVKQRIVLPAWVGRPCHIFLWSYGYPSDLGGMEGPTTPQPCPLDYVMGSYGYLCECGSPPPSRQNPKTSPAAKSPNPRREPDLRYLLTVCYGATPFQGGPLSLLLCCLPLFWVGPLLMKLHLIITSPTTKGATQGPAFARPPTPGGSQQSSFMANKRPPTISTATVDNDYKDHGVEEDHCLFPLRVHRHLQCPRSQPPPQ